MCFDVNIERWVNIHHISVLNPDIASQNVKGFQRRGELGTVLLCVLSFTFYTRSNGMSPQEEEMFGLNTGAESSLSIVLLETLYYSTRNLASQTQ